MKILKSVWLTDFGESPETMLVSLPITIGFVLVETDSNEKRLYVGCGAGKDEKADEQHIAQWGTKIEEDSAIYKLLLFVSTSNSEKKHLIVSSGYGGNTRKPFVQIEHAGLDKPIHISPAEARAFALNILEAADGAESDAFIVEFFKNEMDQDDKVVGTLLMEFRKWRNEHREDTPPNTPVEDL